MKRIYKYPLMALLSLFIMGAYSCGGSEDIPQPETDKATLSPTSLTAEAKGGTLTLTLTTDKSWTATSDQSWCTLSPTSGNGGTNTLTVTVSENPNEQERTAKITVKAGSASATATVKQAEKEGNKTDTNSGDVADMENKNW